MLRLPGRERPGSLTGFWDQITSPLRTQGMTNSVPLPIEPFPPIGLLSLPGVA